MKIILLFPAASGTGISHFLTSIAMIEKEKMAIIDFDSTSIIEDVLKVKDPINYISASEISLKFHTTRFNNLFYSNQHSGLDMHDAIKILIFKLLKELTSIENIKYLIVNMPKFTDNYPIQNIIHLSDSILLFENCKQNTKITLNKSKRVNLSADIDLLSANQKHTEISIKKLNNSPYPNQYELIEEIPYNLRFQLATIQKKTIIELDDSKLIDAVVNIWNKIKNKVNSDK